MMKNIFQHPILKSFASTLCCIHDCILMLLITLCWQVLCKDMRLVLLWPNEPYLYNSILNVFSNKMVMSVNVLCSYACCHALWQIDCSQVVHIYHNCQFYFESQEFHLRLREQHLRSNFWDCAILFFCAQKTHALLSLASPGDGASIWKHKVPTDTLPCFWISCKIRVTKVFYNPLIFKCIYLLFQTLACSVHNLTQFPNTIRQRWSWMLEKIKQSALCGS